MKQSYMRRQGYRYYVYLGPGNISYFEDYDSAKDFADEFDDDDVEVEKTI